MFYQESLDYFVKHKYNFDYAYAQKLAKAEQKLYQIQDIKISLEHAKTDLSWTKTWEHKNWLLKQLENGYLKQYAIFLEKKDGSGKWATLDGITGIICAEDDLRVYEAEIILHNLQKI